MNAAAKANAEIQALEIIIQALISELSKHDPKLPERLAAAAFHARDFAGLDHERAKVVLDVHQRIFERVKILPKG